MIHLQSIDTHLIYEVTSLPNALDVAANTGASTQTKLLLNPKKNAAKAMLN